MRRRFNKMSGGREYERDVLVKRERERERWGKNKRIRRQHDQAIANSRKIE